jgi:hypothetical protein
VAGEGNRSRRKGLEYDAEVRRLWQRYGYDVQPLQRNVEGLFDQLVIAPRQTVLLCDPKRRETLQVPKWIEQAEANALAFADTIGTPIVDMWVIPFRRSGSRWVPPKSYAISPLEDLARLLA